MVRILPMASDHQRFAPSFRRAAAGRCGHRPLHLCDLPARCVGGSPSKNHVPGFLCAPVEASCFVTLPCGRRNASPTVWTIGFTDSLMGCIRSKRGTARGVEGAAPYIFSDLQWCVLGTAPTTSLKRRKFIHSPMSGINPNVIVRERHSCRSLHLHKKSPDRLVRGSLIFVIVNYLAAPAT